MKRFDLRLAAVCFAVISIQAVAVDLSHAMFEFCGKGEIAVFKPGVKLFTDRPYVVEDCPGWLSGKSFLRTSINRTENWTITHSGVLTVLTPVSNPKACSQVDALEMAGFRKVEDLSPFQLFGSKPIDQVEMYQKQVDKGERFRFGKYVVAVDFSEAVQRIDKPWIENEGELLPNGIRLPKDWPPRDMDLSDGNPMPVPYLDSPPEIIPIDVGRQLFVDDFLIENTDLERVFHYPEKYEGNPVLKPETAMERGTEGEALAVRMRHIASRPQPLAAPKSGGCWWNPQKQQFELWYEAGWIGAISYAVSSNGIDWVRPELNVVPGSNQVSPPGEHVDSWTVVRDWWTDDPQSQYKIFVSSGPRPASCFVSPDGIHWSDAVKTGNMGDRSTMFYNPFRHKWVFSIRSGFRGRSRHYWEADDFMNGCHWQTFDLQAKTSWGEGQPVVWAAADQMDMPDPEIGVAAQLYNLDAVAYESIILGFFEIHRGPNNNICAARGTPKITDLNFAYSRDGFHWSRPDRTAAIQSERKVGAWDRGYVQSLGNICTVHGDQLWFYYSGFAGDPENTNKNSMLSGMYANGSTGLAFLRRDGFVSMDAAGRQGALMTRPVIFSGSRLFVNLDASQGVLRVAVLDRNGKPVEPFTLENCRPLFSDSTLEPVVWENGSDLSELAGTPVRFRFELNNGALYSFWVSKDKTGRSDGYIAGGGPGYTGPTDKVGLKALVDEDCSKIKH